AGLPGLDTTGGRRRGEPRPLCYLPDGRGRHPAANVPGDFAADRGTTAAAATSAGVRRSMVMHSRATDRRNASQMAGKIARSTPRPPFGSPVVRVAAGSSRLASREARKSLLFTPVRVSSGECRMNNNHASTRLQNDPRWRRLHDRPWVCPSCGATHVGTFDLAYAKPHAWPGSEEYGPNSAASTSTHFLSEDFCVLNDEHYFVRCILELS